MIPVPALLVVLALGLAPRPGRAEPEVLDLDGIAARLASPDDRIQLEALEALAAPDPDRRLLIPEIASLVDHRIDRIRFAAIRALATLGYFDERCSRALASGLGSRHRYIRLLAAQALGPARAVEPDLDPLVSRALGDPDLRVQAAVLRGLRPTPDLADRLERLAAEGSTTAIRDEAARALRRGRDAGGGSDG